MVEVISYDSRKALARGLASRVAADLRHVSVADGYSSPPFPGGTTPRPFLA